MKKLQKAIIVLDLVLVIVITAGIAGDLLNTDKVTQVFYLLSPSEKETENNELDILEHTDDLELKKVALTFDDGPNPDYTEALLEGLREKDVKATFFLLGSEVELYPDIVKKIHDEGHLIGNHSFKHERLKLLEMEKACERVNNTNDLIYEITGVYPEYFRPPFGEWKEQLDCDVNMIQVLWNIDTLDWKSKNHDKIVKQVVTKVEENDIILMHDAYKTSVSAALEIIDVLKNDGYEFVTVDELILE